MTSKRYYRCRMVHYRCSHCGEVWSERRFARGRYDYAPQCPICLSRASRIIPCVEAGNQCVENTQPEEYSPGGNT